MILLNRAVIESAQNRRATIRLGIYTLIMPTSSICLSLYNVCFEYVYRMRTDYVHDDHRICYRKLDECFDPFSKILGFHPLPVRLYAITHGLEDTCR